MADEDTRSSRLFYHGTREEVRLGDKVRIRRWFRGPVEGVVCYIPGICPRHPELPDDWAIQLPDGSLSVMVYSPDEAPPQPKIRLVARGATFSPLDPAARLENWEGWVDEGEIATQIETVEQGRPLPWWAGLKDFAVIMLWSLPLWAIIGLAIWLWCR